MVYMYYLSPYTMNMMRPVDNGHIMSLAPQANHPPEGFIEGDSHCSWYTCTICLLRPWTWWAQLITATLCHWLPKPTIPLKASLRGDSHCSWYTCTICLFRPWTWWGQLIMASLCHWLPKPTIPLKASLRGIATVHGIHVLSVSLDHEHDEPSHWLP